MARRVLLVEIDASIPGTNTHATWNPADKTGNCTVSAGNLTATAAATANFNAVRGTVAMSAGAWYWETVHTFASGSGYVLSAGICKSGFAFAAAQLGTDATKLSAAGPGQDGQCRYNNVVTGDAGTVLTTNVVRHWLDVDAGTYKAAIGAGAWVTVASGLSGSWFPVAQFTTNTHSIVARFGASVFSHAVPDGARAGVYSIGPATPNTLRVASEAVFTDSSATPADAYYRPRVMRSDLRIKRSARAWTHGDSNSGFSVGEVRLANADGALDGWRDLIFRNCSITIKYGSPEQVRDPSTCTLWLSAICDRIEFGDKVVMVKITDHRALLNKPLQSSTYPAGTQVAALVDRARPVTLGKALNIDPVLSDASTRYFDIHDSPSAVIVEVTDQADPDVLYTDYTPVANGFTTRVQHVGKTAATVIGEHLLGADLIGIDGDMTTWVAGAFTPNPQGWTVTGETSGTVGVHQSPAGSAQIRNTGSGGNVLLGKSAFTAGVGKSYFVDVQVTAFVSGFLRVWSSTAANLMTSVRVPSITAAGSYRFVITPNAGETFLVIGSMAFANSNISIDAVRVYPISPVQYLPEWLTHLVVTRGGLSAGILDTAAINALAASAPYALGFNAREAVMIDEVLRETLHNWCGWFVPTPAGQMTVGRLQVPSSAPVLSLTRFDLTRRPTCVLDAAQGLTDRLGAARNWTLHSDADFATSVATATREKLKVAYQEVCKALGDLAPAYAHALTAQVRDSLLQLRSDALAEISRVATYYRTERFMYDVPALLDISTANALNLGDTINVTYPAFDLHAGKNLVVLDVDSGYWDQEVILKVTG